MATTALVAVKRNDRPCCAIASTVSMRTRMVTSVAPSTAPGRATSRSSKAAVLSQGMKSHARSIPCAPKCRHRATNQTLSEPKPVRRYSVDVLVTECRGVCFMRSKLHSLVALAAGALVLGQYAAAQSDEMRPSRSATEDMQPQRGEDTYPGESSTTRDPTSGDTDRSAAGQGTGSLDTGQIDQRKVEQFADAYVQVQTIQQQANADIEAAKDPMEAEQVRTAAQSDMIAAVERSGLQVEEFNQIVASMAADNELRSRISAAVQKRLDQGATTPAR
nr:hypothetical protein [Gammaproteobacteria bacterium]